MTNRCAVVTGAASGIGLETVRRLIGDGYFISAIDIDVEGLNNISLRTDQLISFSLDVSDRSAMEAAVMETEKHAGRVDVLVNNAGIGIAAPLHETSPEQWDRILAVNLTAQFIATRAVLPSMLSAGSGVILNIASVAALVGVKNRAAYCASKAGVLGLTRSVAVDYARHGIRAVAICPGTVDTPWIQKILLEDPNPAKRKAEMASRQLDGRFGTPEDVAAAVAFLASEDARFINGSVFVMDGGMTAV